MEGEEATTAAGNAAVGGVLDDTRTRILRKGDLVRIQKIREVRLKHRDGALGKINRSIPIPQDEVDAMPDDEIEKHPHLYDIDFVLGGKITKCHRRELLYTTAEAEGMIGDGGRTKRKRKPSSVVLEAKEQEPEPVVKKKKKGGPKNGKKGGKTAAKPAKAAAKGAAKKAAGGKRKAAAAAKAENKKPKAVAKAAAEPEPEEDDVVIAKDLYEKHKKDFERSIARLEKMDQFGFFLEAPPEAVVEAVKTEYTDPVKTEPASTAPSPTPMPMPSADVPTPVQSESSASIPQSTLSASSQNSTAAPSQPVPSAAASSPAAMGLSASKSPPVAPPPDPFAKTPLTWHDLRERNEAGRYDLDRLARLEKERKKRLGPYIWDRRKRRKQQELDGNKKIETWELREISTTTKATGKAAGKRSLKRNGVRVHPRVLCPTGIDWDLFRQDLFAMCDAGIARDPQGSTGRSGTLGHAAKKVKELMGQVYERTGKRHMQEMEFADSRHEFTVLLHASTNQEAAFQGDWRRIPFPERQYERLKSDVVCAGLSALDQQSASQEKQSALPDSFVGLSYTYNDTGQSEGWMKSVFETANSKTKKKELSDEEKAASALAADDGVVRAQVRATMRTLLIGVQDKVMTDAGVLKHSELRSANWDKPETAVPPLTGPSSPPALNNSAAKQVPSSGLSSFSTEGKQPDLVEQSVWGIDCYTRRNVLICVEKDLDSETAVEFLEKWLLPAINACPVELAHDLKNAAKILEGAPLQNGNDDASKAKTVQSRSKSPTSKQSTSPSKEEDTSDIKETWSHSLIGKALLHKMQYFGPPWLKAAAYQLRRAIKALGHDFFRVHPKGHGSIVLSPKVKANSLVTFYRGEVYPSWRWGEKMDAIEQTQVHIGLRPNLPDFYNMALERPQADPQGYGLMIVDASRKAGHGSMLSHSCDPTCEVRVAALNGQLCLAMATLRDIEQGEELTFDYNAVTESLEEYQAAVCLCGNNKCRGSFLHFATADCYQQVLNRNSPMAVRFANLVKASTKKVMAEEDEKTLATHGFGTAAFGAVSFNRHLEVSVTASRRRLDSMENIPVWLRTYVADVLRYIEYERRALPIALLCDHFKTAKSVEETEEKKPVIRKKKKEKEDKPENSFQYFVRKNTPAFLEELGEEAVAKMKGMEVQQNLRRVASGKWKKLSDAEKLEWKERAISEWKAKKAAEAKEGAGGKAKEAPPPAVPAGDAKKKSKKDVGSNSKDGKNGKDGDNLNLSKISFESADAEGVSAMEQRIQQLTQALSRIGRLLDHHREKYADPVEQSESSALKNKIHQPLSIMTDHEVVSWMWRSESGVVRSLLRSIKTEKCVDPSLHEGLVAVTKKHEALDKFVEDPSSSGVSASQARSVLTEALLGLRDCLHDGVQELAKGLKQYELQRGRMKAKARRDDAKESARNEVKAVLQDLVDQVVIRCEDSDKPASSNGDSTSGSALLQMEEEKASSCEPARLPWLEHYSERWKLEAAADILLMYARTTTFFKIVPYTPLESTSIEVYARELGNVVPRSKIQNAQSAEIQKSTNIVLVQESGNDSVMLDEAPKAKKKAAEVLCDPDETVAKVTVSYTGDYVVSQLLQWFNGGIGQKQGLPDLVGCVTLPSIQETWKSSAGAGGKSKKTTLYRSQLRPRLFEWFRDPHQRGSPFPEELSKVFKPPELEYRDDHLELYPLGSPILDFLVMGEDANINQALAALDRERLRDGISDAVKDSAANRLESAVDEAMPAQAVAKWVQCENPDCLKWRRLPFFVDVDVLPEQFFCKDNTWNNAAQSCDSPEDVWDENDTNVHNEGVAKESDEQMLVREDNNGAAELSDLARKYEIGERYDVHRTGKDFYCTGEVVDTDFKNGKKRVKMHFPKVPEKYDEWFELPSDRLAPLNSKQVSKAEREKAKREAKILAKNQAILAKSEAAKESNKKAPTAKKVAPLKAPEPSAIAASLLALRHSTPNMEKEVAAEESEAKQPEKIPSSSAQAGSLTKPAKTTSKLLLDDKMNDLFDTDSEDDAPPSTTGKMKILSKQSGACNGKAKVPVTESTKVSRSGQVLERDSKSTVPSTTAIPRKAKDKSDSPPATAGPKVSRIPRKTADKPAAPDVPRIPRKGTDPQPNCPPPNQAVTETRLPTCTIEKSSEGASGSRQSPNGSPNAQVRDARSSSGASPPSSETRGHSRDRSSGHKVAPVDSRQSPQARAQSHANGYSSRPHDGFRNANGRHGRRDGDARGHDYHSSAQHGGYGNRNGSRGRRDSDTRDHGHHSQRPNDGYRRGGGDPHYQDNRPSDNYGNQRRNHDHHDRPKEKHPRNSDKDHPLLGPRFAAKKK